MLSIIDFIHSVFAALVGGIIGLASGLGQFWVIVIISTLAGAVLVLLYRQVSFQARLKKVKRSIHAALLEVVLFRHNSKLSLVAQLSMLAGGAKYFLLAVPPLIILALPSIFLMAQLQTWFGYEGIKVGRPIIVTLDTKTAVGDIQLAVDPSVQSVGPLRDLKKNEYVWRLTPSRAGEFPIALNASSGGLLNFNLVANDGLSQKQAVVSQGLLDRLLYPTLGHSASKSELIQRFEIGYPGREYNLAGYSIHWIYIFLIFSLISGFIVGKIFSIEL